MRVNTGLFMVFADSAGIMIQPASYTTNLNSSLAITLHIGPAEARLMGAALIAAADRIASAVVEESA